jgi:hypothetical protein
MNSFSKLLALAVFGVGTALIASTTSARAQAPAPAQAERQAAQILPGVQCCIPALRPVNTNSTWTVKPPTGPTIQAVPVNPKNAGWHIPFQGSQWIATSVHDGTAYGPPGGPYTYTYKFCLCGLPKGVTSAFPASLSLSVLSDNSFVAYLNGNQIGANPSATAFTTPMAVTNASQYFQAGSNSLTFVVSNQPNSPTGLDVSGWISGYFCQ